MDFKRNSSQISLLIIFIIICLLALAKYLFSQGNQLTNKEKKQINKIEQDSIFRIIDSQIYRYKIRAFYAMVEISHDTCSKIHDISGDILYDPGEEIINIRKFNKRIIDDIRLSKDTYYDDTSLAAIFVNGLHLFKETNKYDSLAIVYYSNFYSKELIEAYKKEDRWEKRNSFKWVVPPSPY